MASKQYLGNFNKEANATSYQRGKGGNLAYFCFKGDFSVAAYSIITCIATLILQLKKKLISM